MVINHDPNANAWSFWYVGDPVRWYIFMAGVMLLGAASAFVVTGHVLLQALRTGAIGFNNKKYSFRGQPIAAGLIVASWVAIIGLTLLGLAGAVAKFWEVQSFWGSAHHVVNVDNSHYASRAGWTTRQLQDESSVIGQRN